MFSKWWLALFISVPAVIWRRRLFTSLEWAMHIPDDYAGTVNLGVLGTFPASSYWSTYQRRQSFFFYQWCVQHRFSLRHSLQVTQHRVWLQSVISSSCPNNFFSNDYFTDFERRTFVDYFFTSLPFLSSVANLISQYSQTARSVLVR